jgi:hypothetical protein
MVGGLGGLVVEDGFFGIFLWYLSEDKHKDPSKCLLAVLMSKQALAQVRCLSCKRYGMHGKGAIERLFLGSCGFLSSLN